MSIRVGITSLGCAKNLVDSEVILGYLARGGFEISDDLDAARVIIVNTCSFIGEAEEESGLTIEQLLRLKGEGEIDLVIVAGCLPSRRGPLLFERFPRVDYFLAPSEIPSVAGIVRALLSGERREPRAGLWREASEGWFLYDHRSPRVRLSPPHYAYLKISEGCSNRCGYCLIPSVKGPLRSREMESVVWEARALADGGVKEINIISQDTTAYGIDRYGESRLGELLERLCEIGGLRWIRLLYGHPARYDERLLRLISGEPRLCRYIDFPLQHISDRILSAMNRRTTRAAVTGTLGRARELIPGLSVRTTFIVGFPGETDDDFEELLDFIGEARFEHLGAFIYSAEEGTPAAGLPGWVPPDVAESRYHRLMSLQQSIVKAAQEDLRGRVVEVLVDERLDGGTFRLRGRTEGDAPEVDGSVYILEGGAGPGEFTEVRVVGTMDYDLVGAAPDARDQSVCRM